MIKLTGAEWKRFYSDPAIWGDDKKRTSKYHDDDDIEVDGRSEDIDLSTIPDDSVVTVSCGTIMSNYDMDFEADLVKTLRQWLKRQTHAIVTVEVVKYKEPKLRQFIKSIGGRVL